MQEPTENNSRKLEPRYASDWLSGLADGHHQNYPELPAVLETGIISRYDNGENTISNHFKNISVHIIIFCSSSVATQTAERDTIFILQSQHLDPMGHKEANRLMDEKVTFDISVPAINIHLFREFDIRTAHSNPIIAYRWILYCPSP